MRHFEKTFQRQYREIMTEVHFHSNNERTLIAPEVDNFLKLIMDKELDIFNHFQLEDINEKANALHDDMRMLIYLLHPQHDLTIQLRTITLRLMEEYEREVIALQVRPMSTCPHYDLGL